MAILFAGLVTTYCVLWVVHVKHPVPQPGFSDYKYSLGAHSMTVGVVYSDSPAKEAGLRPGDRCFNAPPAAPTNGSPTQAAPFSS